MPRQKEKVCTLGTLLKHVIITEEEQYEGELPRCKACENLLETWELHVLTRKTDQYGLPEMQAYCEVCPGYWCVKCSGTAVSEHRRFRQDSAAEARLRVERIQAGRHDLLDSLGRAYSGVGYGRDKPQSKPSFANSLLRASRRKYTERVWGDVIGSDGESSDHETTQPLDSAISLKENFGNQGGDYLNRGQDPEKMTPLIPSYFSTRRDPDGTAYSKFYGNQANTFQPDSDISMNKHSSLQGGDYLNRGHGTVQTMPPGPSFFSPGQDPAILDFSENYLNQANDSAVSMNEHSGIQGGDYLNRGQGTIARYSTVQTMPPRPPFFPGQDPAVINFSENYRNQENTFRPDPTVSMSEHPNNQVSDYFNRGHGTVQTMPPRPSFFSPGQDPAIIGFSRNHSIQPSDSAVSMNEHSGIQGGDYLNRGQGTIARYSTLQTMPPRPPFFPGQDPAVINFSENYRNQENTFRPDSTVSMDEHPSNQGGDHINQEGVPVKSRGGGSFSYGKPMGQVILIHQPGETPRRKLIRPDSAQDTDEAITICKGTIIARAPIISPNNECKPDYFCATCGYEILLFAQPDERWSGKCGICGKIWCENCTQDAIQKIHQGRYDKKHKCLDCGCEGFMEIDTRMWLWLEDNEVKPRCWGCDRGWPDLGKFRQGGYCMVCGHHWCYICKEGMYPGTQPTRNAVRVKEEMRDRIR
ncbi:hypothetical protein FPQ18DRAFT_310603 [Pyronema domesticum]|nr:hypothetical protein FPQ18DRAFT_310603 [Pyronema domesticum]